MQNDPLAQKHWNLAAEEIGYLANLRANMSDGDTEKIVGAITLLANTVYQCNMAVAHEIVASREQTAAAKS